MGEYIDKTEGKVKELYGRASGNRSKEVEGRAQQARGGLKGMIERMREAFQRAFHVEDRTQRHA